MGIKLNSAKCPECGASLPVEEGRTYLFCSYCGTKILITNENEYVYRHIDEAGVKQAETDRIVKLKKMELAEKNREAKEKHKSLKIKLSIILGIVAIITIAIGFTFDGADGLIEVGMIAAVSLMLIWYKELTNRDSADDYDGMVRVPSGIDGYDKKNYADIEAQFRGAGFTNIQCVPLHDLRTTLLKKPNTVKSIAINGEEIFSSGKKYMPDATVMISYHSYAER